MKLTGFLIEHNLIKEAVPLSLVADPNNHPYEYLDKIIEYLNEGVLLLAWMGYVIDPTNKILICPDAYYTDGVWVWPQYFTYYLKKYPNYKLDEEFVKHVLLSNFKSTVKSVTFDKIAMEKELALLLSNNQW